MMNFKDVNALAFINQKKEVVLQVFNKNYIWSKIELLGFWGNFIVLKFVRSVDLKPKKFQKRDLAPKSDNEQQQLRSLIHNPTNRLHSISIYFLVLEV